MYDRNHNIYYLIRYMTLCQILYTLKEPRGCIKEEDEFLESIRAWGAVGIIRCFLKGDVPNKRGYISRRPLWHSLCRK